MTDSHSIAAIYSGGKSLRLTAEACGVSISAVRYALVLSKTKPRARGEGQRFGVRRAYGHTGGKPLLKKRVFNYDAARAAYESGKSLNQISDAIGVNAETIRRGLKGSGVAMRRRGTSKGVSTNRIYGGTRITRSGYVYKRMDFPGDVRGLLHRIIAQRALGRKLKPNEVVHHINCDRADNRSENLLVCTSEYHADLHARMRAHPYWSTLEK